MLGAVLHVFFLVALLYFFCRRLLRYLRYLQQENYQSVRFLQWIWRKRCLDRRGTASLFLAFLFSWISSPLGWGVGALLFAATSPFEQDPRSRGKLKLQMTARAKRIFGVALALAGIMQTLLFFVEGPLFWVLEVLAIQSLPLLLPVAVGLLTIDEARRQHQLTKEAQAVLHKVSPYVIGITGSYGKTSTKDALGNILQVVLGPTFWPEKGVNTPMGITREIRCHLKPGIRYAVVEMAAYGRGSIARLCRLTPPSAGIITGVGVAHLDRFGGRDKIRLAKEELAQAVPNDGILVCNGDNDGARAIARENSKRTTLLYGFDNVRGDLDAWISAWQTTPAGTCFSICWKGSIYKGFTPLLGKPALSNIAAAFAMACALGAQPEFVIGAITNLQAVGNRLEVQREKGLTYIKDAYNSNPEGFSAALDVLKVLPAKRKILVTPGMIELADEQVEVHENIGRKASQVCDFTIIVGNVNRDSMVKGLLLGGIHRDNIFLAETRELAFAELRRISAEGDAILIENDLPDLYEAKESF